MDPSQYVSGIHPPCVLENTIHHSKFLKAIVKRDAAGIPRPGGRDGPGLRTPDDSGTVPEKFFRKGKHMNDLPIKRALISVTDKSGLDELGAVLTGFGAELVSTGGTRKKLTELGFPVTSVSDVTGFPEILGGRVKTLHPHIHGGVLADKDNPEHLATLEQHGIKPFDMICVNLYDFASAVKKGLDLKNAVEEIDIGGPTLLRASAKNFHSILVVPDTGFYPRVIEELKKTGGSVSLGLRKEMAAETFVRVSAYDAMIAKYLSSGEA